MKINNSAKNVLLEHANENPAETIVVSNVNGSLQIGLKYGSAGSLIFMLHQLTVAVHAVTQEISGINKEELLAGIKASQAAALAPPPLKPSGPPKG